MYKFKLFENGKTNAVGEIEIELIRENNVCIIKIITAADLNNQTFKDWNYFNALNQLRTELEKKNLLIACMGSLRYFYPSRMCLDMGQGEVGYKTKVGKSATMKDILRTFDTVDSSTDLATVNEQLDFHEAWKKSL